MKNKFSQLIAFSLALVLLCAGVSFADSAFPEQPVASNLSSYVSYPKEGGIVVGSSNGLDVFAVPHGNSGLPFDCYFFTYSFNNTVYLVCATSDSIDSTSQFYAYTSSSSPLFASAISNTDNTTGLMYALNTPPQSVSILNTYIPVFSSLQEGLSAVLDAVNSVSGVSTFHFSVPSGYVLTVSSDSAFLVNSRSYSISGSWNFPRSGDYRVNGAQHGSMLSSAITSGSPVSVSPLPSSLSSADVLWTALNVNILGSASNYSFSSSNPVSVTSGNSYVIYYPYYYGTYTQSEGNTGLTTNSVDIGVTLSIDHSAPLVFNLVPLKPSLNYNNGVFSYSDDFGSTDSFSGTLTETEEDNYTISFENSSGDAPASGGEDADVPSINPQNTIFGVISSLVDDINGLLEKGANAVRGLVNSGSEFMRSVAQMYTWLPSEICTVIMAAFTVLLVIGVIKFLWR